MSLDRTQRNITRALLAVLGLMVLLIVLACCAPRPAQATPLPHPPPERVATDAVPRAALAHRQALKREAQRVWGLNAPSASFAAQIHQESRWRPDARSPVGAQGLAQFMPATARWMVTVDRGLASVDPFNPTWSIRALVVYDKWLYDRVMGANDCERVAFAMAAYNGGLGWVHRRKDLSDEPLVCFDSTCAINPGIHPANQRENEGYPRVILLRYEPLYAADMGWGRGVCQ